MTKEEFLAMSLPYGLKMLQSCEHWFILEPNRVVLLTGIADVDGKAPMQYGNEPTETTIFYRLNKDITGTDYVLRFKPILRPLSDLTKEIEHKGERFVPIKEIQKRNDFIHIMNGRFVIGVKSIYDIDELPTWVTQLLIKWHFDLFDGIKNEEAIDVNTLEVNPYK